MPTVPITHLSKRSPVGTAQRDTAQWDTTQRDTAQREPSCWTLCEWCPPALCKEVVLKCACEEIEGLG